MNPINVHVDTYVFENAESQISNMCCVGEFFVLQINIIMDKHV
jgi:hypothetical protein